MIKKIGLGVCFLMASLILVACGTSQSSDLQQDIVEKGKLVVAVSPDYPPFEFKALIDGKDKVVGADIDLAQDIADALGVELEVSTMSFDNVLTSLKTGKADIAISGLSVTKERQNAYTFSETYYTTENAILIRQEDQGKYSHLEQLAGKKVAVLKGSTEENLAKEQLPKSQIIPLTAMGEAINELKSGLVDAVDLEKPVAEGFMAQNADLSLAKVTLTVGDGDAKAVAMPKGKASKELQKTINKVISKMVKEDTYGKYLSEAAKLTEKSID